MFYRNMTEIDRQTSNVRDPSFSETDEPKETRKVDARLNFCFPDTVRIYRYSVQVARQPLASRQRSTL